MPVSTIPKITNLLTSWQLPACNLGLGVLEGCSKGTFRIVPNGTERQITLRKRSVIVGMNGE